MIILRDHISSIIASLCAKYVVCKQKQCITKQSEIYFYCITLKIHLSWNTHDNFTLALRKINSLLNMHPKIRVSLCSSSCLFFLSNIPGDCRRNEECGMISRGIKLKINFKNHLFSHFTILSTNTYWVSGIGLDDRLMKKMIALINKQLRNLRRGDHLQLMLVARSFI